MSDDGQFAELGATRMQRVNQVCNRFEAAWRSGQRPNLAEHLASAPAREQPVLARMLIELDVDYRLMHGESPQPDDYRSQLPFEASWLNSLISGAQDAAQQETARFPAAENQESQPRSTHRPASEEALPRSVGDYLLLERIGGGGMGVVYKAQHQRMKRIVALKLIRPDDAQGLESQQRFQREVEAAARLHHPYIVTAYDARVEEGTWCLITEFVAGQDLARVVQQSGPLPLARALHCISQAAEALAYAHQQGIVHRDIKPANLLLAESGNVKVLDMGLASLQETEADPDATRAAWRLTQTGYVVGTVDFMAPEQARNSADADARSDIYSLGCTFYYLLTGRPAFHGTTVMETLIAHREEPIPSLSGVRSVLLPEVEAVFQRMMAKDPADRFQTMNEVLLALKTISKQLEAIATITSPSLTTGNTSPLAADKSSKHALETDSRNSLRARSWLILGGFIFLIGLGWGAMDWWRSERTPGPLIEPSPGAGTQRIGGNGTGAAQLQAQAAEELGVPVEITGELGMKLRLIPASRIDLSNRVLSLASPFYMGTTEVTVGQFRRFVDATHYRTEAETNSNRGWGMREGRWSLEEGFHWNNLGDHPRGDEMPVVNISWNDARAFCDWLNGLPNVGGTYRLPTETEWEVACRAGSSTDWYFGTDEAQLEDHAWYQANAEQQLHPVAQKLPNAFGCYDMLGNESEWCWDRFDPSDPNNQEHAQRGGSFSHNADEVTSAARWGSSPASPSHGAFRVARDLTDK